ncbi:lysophospholipid acyltransferase family protein [Pseudovibrio brasiliensis]|uniref:Lysophospholipid acyltransferase family protein n=1 Tax=Pseudovibrio brasiliensis TaxID=1898042 RepID=A0ABX8ARJ8_9HYPH|nr:lysophospholipid acyltransferase family protein [Pseudovibrio brasiliensis]QUS56867.1 lysophospholipid acyltransferase family protein [Pseudovibrio brasiliensis]
MLKKLGKHPLVMKLVGYAMAYYLLFVRKSSKFTLDPPNFYEDHEDTVPYVVSMWHGQHFMMPFARPKDWDVRVMISRSADGEMQAICASKLGLGLIRAAGAQRASQISKRGGMRGFIEALRALKEGGNVAMTADVPKGPSRKAGKGIVQLAKHSGRPLLPVAIATSRHYDLDTWDKASINLPFSHIALCFGEPIPVPADASDEQLEDIRQLLETRMNETTDKAYAIAKSGKK